MDKLKRFVDCYIDTETCNLKCHYCYIAQLGKFKNKLAKFKYSPKEIRKALSVKRLGGECLINLCAGGETLLSKEVVDLVLELLEEGHYVMIVTNGTLTNRFKEIAMFPKELLERLFFKFSFHYLELKRLNWMDRFFNNIKRMIEAGCSFTLEITPSDELIPYIDDVKNICMEKVGAYCHVTIARDDRTKGIVVLSDKSFEEYKKIWGTFDSKLFSYKSEIFYQKRKEFCYAGDWSVYINLSSGEMKQCYFGRVLDNIYKNIDQPLNFEAVGCNCKMAHCYNGHAYLAIGDIPKLNAPTYAELRNRVTKDGKEWLNPKMKSFMSQKLKDNNEEYSSAKRKKINKSFERKYIMDKSKKILNKIGEKINAKEKN